MLSLLSPGTLEADGWSWCQGDDSGPARLASPEGVVWYPTREGKSYVLYDVIGDYAAIEASM